jgi:hypothetical protein
MERFRKRSYDSFAAEPSTATRVPQCREVDFDGRKVELQAGTTRDVYVSICKRFDIAMDNIVIFINGREVPCRVNVPLKRRWEVKIRTVLRAGYFGSVASVAEMASSIA